METQQVAQSVHGPCQSKIVCLGGGHRLYRLPTPWDELWWFDTDWNAVADPFAEGPLCYFIGADHGPVKIGFSSDPQKRAEFFQLSSPYKLTVLATVAGGLVTERAYHLQFDAARLHGEWFERTPELLAEIERLSA